MTPRSSIEELPAPSYYESYNNGMRDIIIYIYLVLAVISAIGQIYTMGQEREPTTPTIVVLNLIATAVLFWLLITSLTPSL